MKSNYITDITELYDRLLSECYQILLNDFPSFVNDTIIMKRNFWLISLHYFQLNFLLVVSLFSLANAGGHGGQ